MLHAFEPDELAGELLNLRRLSVDDQHLKACVVIQMSVTRRDHQGVMRVLEFSQLFGNAISVMIVDEGYRADDRGIGTGCPLCNKAISDQVAKGLRPVRVTERGNMIVESLEKIGIESNADSAEDAHVHSCIRTTYPRKYIVRWFTAKAAIQASASI